MFPRRPMPKDRCRRRSVISRFACRRGRISAAWKAAYSSLVPSCASCSLLSRFPSTSLFGRVMCFAGVSISMLVQAVRSGNASPLRRSVVLSVPSRQPRNQGREGGSPGAPVGYGRRSLSSGAFLAMVFGLPHRYGGFQLPDLAVNRRLRPSRKAQQIARRATLVPDIPLCRCAPGD